MILSGLHCHRSEAGAFGGELVAVAVDEVEQAMPRIVGPGVDEIDVCMIIVSRLFNR